jgi:uncharacterized protein (TIGR00369 family)
MSDRPSADQLKLDVAGLEAFLRGAFPHAPPEFMARLVEVRPGFVRFERKTNPWDLRPGDLVSGPTQMGLVDTVAYLLVAAHFGPVEMAVTTHLNMQFLRPCRPGVLSADAGLLKLGRRLVNMDVRVWTDAPDKPVAHATVTYALP